MKSDYFEKAVWPASLRLVHWTLALGVLVLAVSGGMLGSGMLLNEVLIERLHGLHVTAGQVTGFALVARILLLVMDSGVGGWRALVLKQHSLPALVQMLKFYVSFGRSRIPGFYAHDPLWLAIYPAVFVVLAVQTFTGLSLEYRMLRSISGLGADVLSTLHDIGAQFVFWLAGLHVASVLLREIRGKGYEVSAMIHGNKIFTVEESSGIGAKRPQEVKVSVELRPPEKR